MNCGHWRAEESEARHVLHKSHPALPLAVDMVVPLHCMAAAQEFAFLILCLFMALDAP